MIRTDLSIDRGDRPLGWDEHRSLVRTLPSPYWPTPASWLPSLTTLHTTSYSRHQSGQGSAKRFSHLGAPLTFCGSTDTVPTGVGSGR